MAHVINMFPHLVSNPLGSSQPCACDRSLAWFNILDNPPNVWGQCRGLCLLDRSQEWVGGSGRNIGCNGEFAPQCEKVILGVP